MSVLAIRSALRRLRRRAAVLVGVVVVAGAITAHRSGLPMDTNHDAGMSSVVEMCLGVFSR